MTKHALHRFLRKKRRSRRPVCVHPWTKGFVPLFHWSPLPPFSSIAGGSRVCSWREPTKLQVQTRISKEDALSTYLRLTFNQAVPILPFLIPWWFTILSLKPSSSSFFQQPRFLQHVIASEPFVKTPSTHRTFHRAVPSPFFLEIELTENQ